MIDINKSFIHFFTSEDMGWRTNIKSVLSSKSKNFFLVKECRAETMSQRPFFNHQGRYEFLAIVENDKVHVIRTSATDGNKNNIKLDTSLKNIKYKIENKINPLRFEEVHEILLTGKTINIYCEIEYEHEGIKYSLISKCEYLNYSLKKNSNKYVQPIFGYVPFIDKNEIKYGYVVLKTHENNNGYLEFLLNEKSSIFDVNSNQNLLKLYIKKFLNTLLFFYKKNDFTKLVSIKESKINFFSYS